LILSENVPFYDLPKMSDKPSKAFNISFQGSVNENSPAGSSILEVSATDDDGGENGKVYYR
jgi:hypothetical protein